MAYTAWSVVFGEQPSASKWNILGTNDAGFRDGSNFSLNNNVIPANALATNSLLLGVSYRTSSFSTTAVNTITEVTDTSLTITVPAGGRGLQLTAHANDIRTTAGAGQGVDFDIYEGATLKAQGFYANVASGYHMPAHTEAFIPAPSAGSHTYSIKISHTAAGTLTVDGTATSPIYLLAVLL